MSTHYTNIPDCYWDAYVNYDYPLQSNNNGSELEKLKKENKQLKDEVNDMKNRITELENKLMDSVTQLTKTISSI